jgi:hypothetical protein
VAWGLVPKAEVVTNPEMLFVAIGILGATVMPHVRPQGGMGGGGGGGKAGKRVGREVRGGGKR